VADHVTVVGHGVFFSDKARGLFVATDHGGGKRRAGIIISHARPQNGLYGKPPLAVECVRFIIVLTPNLTPRRLQRRVFLSTVLENRHRHVGGRCGRARRIRLPVLRRTTAAGSGGQSY